MKKYQDDQAWKEPIREYLGTKGLTLDDYGASKELLYRHNVGSGGATEKALLDAWDSDSGSGKALRAMSEWQEWQVKNVQKPPPHSSEWVKIAETSPNWKGMQGGHLFENRADFVNFTKDRAAGKTVFYRKGGLNREVISTTGHSGGAKSGSSHFKPDRAFTFDQMKSEGYHLVSGARGMVGVTSDAEGEYIWLRPRKR